jgi:hypothetical protein
VDAITAPAPPPEGTRLQKKIEVCGQALIQLLDPRESYRILDHQAQLIRMADSRYATVLVERRLIVGVVNGKGVMSHLALAKTKTAAQVRNVLKLKPAAKSICNRATVVKVLPTTYTHRSSLAKGL